MEKKPLKRTEEIMPLSREHHFSLLFSWKILQGLKNGTTVDRMANYVSYFWENNLKLHFEQEEVALFSHFPDDEMVNVALAEHETLRKLIALIVANGGLADERRQQLENLALLLKSHVRMEERELFPALEERLSGEALKQAALVLHDMCDTPRGDDYPDEFWNVK